MGHVHVDNPSAQLGALVGMDAGRDRGSINFNNYYGRLNPNFDINCVACCWQYLTKVRGYQEARNGNFIRVTFGDPRNGEYTNCFLDQCSGNSGQYKTGPDLSPQRHMVTTPNGTRKSLLDKSHTYHLYADHPVQNLIAVGEPVWARIESISVDVLKVNEITGTSLNYCNAALLELHRQMNRKGSFVGKCELRRNNIRSTQSQDQKVDDLSDKLEGTLKVSAVAD